jgi:hypothetical protein
VYEGVYRAIDSSGNPSDKEVAIEFIDNNLSWNLESATWERQSEAKQMTDAEWQKCKSR